jgi:hypothetical protein
MAYVESLLDAFSGEMGYDDIMKRTYKEMGLLKKHRDRRIKLKNKSPGTMDFEKDLKKMKM